MEFKGLYTALVTPFKNGMVDFSKLRELVEFQVDAGVEGIVLLGTTGESPTISDEEHSKIVETVVSQVKGRCKVIAGAGSNATAIAVDTAKNVRSLGVDATLQVVPYYNKPTQDGMYRHFSKIAEVELPVIIYNIPGRTGVGITPETIAKLSQNPNISALKESGGNVNMISEILSICNITILSGDDFFTLPMLSLGAKGVISVASNICPKPLKEMINAFFSGDLEKARKIHYKYYKFMRDIFIETNPIPIKAAMAMRGMIEEEYRLPLCNMQYKNRQILIEAMNSVGI